MLHFLKDFPNTVDKCLVLINEIPEDWIPPEDGALFSSLTRALKLVADANPDPKQVKKIYKFISAVEK